MEDIQRLSARVIQRVLRGRNLDAELAALWQAEPALDLSRRGAIQDICFGTLRLLGPIDAWLDALLTRPLVDDRLRHLLRAALYQLEHTRAAPHAVVDGAVRACGLLRLSSAKGLVNAVLRNFIRRRAAMDVPALTTDEARYSHPPWWIEKLRVQYPDAYTRILEAGNRRPPLTLRVNTRRISRSAYLERLGCEGISARAAGTYGVILSAPMAVERLPGFSEGLVSVQDLAAQWAAPCLDLFPGARALDACAAPGGKTAHMLEQVDLELTALDIDRDRLDRVAANLDRLGLTARLVCGDAGALPDWWDGVPFDRILIDAPCTASGVVRRHPDIKWLRRQDDIARCTERQQHILETLWQALAGGGKLLYATCSVFHEENHVQIARFLERHADARRLPLPAADITTSEPPGQFLPEEEHDGFFYALLQKI